MTRTVSVIINTYQRAESLARTLASLQQLDYPSFEVIVVNGPSTDRTEEVLDGYGDRITVGRCLERNLSKSRNIGIRLAVGEIVAFIDDDAYPDPAWLDRLAEAYDDPGVAAAGGPVYNYTGSDIQAWRSFVDRFGNSHVEHVAKLHPYGAASTPFAPYVPYTIGTNCSFRRDVLVAIGGFDETFEYYLEESDVCCRLVGLGHMVAQLDDGFVYHKFLPSWVRERPDVVKDYRQVLKSKAYFALKHGMADHSFAEVCADIAHFFQICARDVEAAAAQGHLDAQDREKFELDAAESSNAALAAWSGPPGTRPPAWFGDQRRPFCPFGRPFAEPRLHLCLVSQEYPPDRVNGIGRVVHSLATGLAEAGHVVHVITRGTTHRQVDLEEGVWVHRVPVQAHLAPDSGTTVPGHLWDYSASMFDEVLRIHQHRAVDIVQAPNWDSEAIAFLEDGRLPVVVALYTPLKTLIAVDPVFGRSLAGDDPTLRQMVDLERHCYRSADALLACGPSVVDEIESQYGIDLPAERVGLVAHGLADRQTDAGTEPGPGLASEVLFVGRLEPRKGADVLLDAASALLERHPGLVITLAGDNSLPTVDGRTLRARFEASAPASVGERVRFVGPVDDAELMALYARCDALVVPSRYESFGLMLLEAMMFEKAVVASDVGGMRDIVVDGVTGLLVPPGDPGALAAALGRLIGDPELAKTMGAAGRRRYETHYRRERMVGEAVGFYRAVVAAWGSDRADALKAGAR